MRYDYNTSGTCSQMISFDIDGDIITNVSFFGGCNGNLQGIGRLVEGQTVDFIVDRCEGIKCGFKSTSCPDQLAKAVKEAYESSK